MLELGLKVFFSYLLGSLNGALIVGRLAGGIDIRKLGSGNAGGTNALRTQGRWFAARVVFIDVLKGLLPPLVLPGLLLPGLALDPAVSREWLTLACAAAAVVGHCYPVFFQFAGGKGAATALGALAGISPALLLPGSVVWVLVLLTTGFVGLATMLAAAVLPVWVYWQSANWQSPLVVFLLWLALFVTFTHRGNIRRMLSGQESRMARPRLFRRAGS
jgi:acyl phosphate:glycerol-3-phosphate acyltransferase